MGPEEEFGARMGNLGHLTPDSWVELPREPRIKGCAKEIEDSQIHGVPRPFWGRLELEPLWEIRGFAFLLVAKPPRLPG